jgi:lysophospholipase L1-like esterase
MMSNRKLHFVFILIIILSFSFQIEIKAQNTNKKIDLDIVFIGNSITEGALLEKPLQEAPPVITCEKLRQHAGIGEINFINKGRSGYTTLDFLPSKGGTFEDVLTATAQLHKDTKRLLIFSISLGTNDSAEKGPNGSPVSPIDYHKNMDSIINQLIENFPNCNIILQQPIWYSPNTYNGAEYMEKGLARLQSYFPELQAIVIAHSQIKPNQVFLGDMKGYDYFKDSHLKYLVPETGKAGTFYLHPNKEGAAILGGFWADAIYDFK